MFFVLVTHKDFKNRLLKSNAKSGFSTDWWAFFATICRFLDFFLYFLIFLINLYQKYDFYLFFFTRSFTHLYAHVLSLSLIIYKYGRINNVNIENISWWLAVSPLSRTTRTSWSVKLLVTMLCWFQCLYGLYRQTLYPRYWAPYKFRYNRNNKIVFWKKRVARVVLEDNVCMPNSLYNYSALCQEIEHGFKKDMIYGNKFNFKIKSPDEVDAFYTKFIVGIR